MDLSQIENRLRQIEERLTRIENSSGKAKSEPEPQSTPPPKPAAFDSSIKPINYAEHFKKEAHVQTHSLKSINWLGYIAVLCFVLAAGFIIKLSIDSGWLTPGRQIGLAGLFGISLIAAGLSLMKTDRSYASLLPGAGIIILYLTSYAGYGYYSLFSMNIALVMTSLIAALCVWLYTEIKHDIYAITASVGAYLSPLILNFATQSSLLSIDNFIFFSYYYALCSIAFAVISIWVQSRILTMISAYLAIIVTGVIGSSLQDYLVPVAILLALHFIVFAFGTYLHSKHTSRPLTTNEAWSFFPVLFVFYAMEYNILDQISHANAPWFSLGFAGLIMGLYLSAKNWMKNQELQSSGVVYAFVTLVVFHSVYLELLPDDVRPWLFTGLILAYTMLLKTKVQINNKDSNFLIPKFALIIIIAIEYFNIAGHLISNDDSYFLVIAFASVASLWFLLFVHPQMTRISHRNHFGSALLAATHLLAITSLYRLVYDYGSLAVSASWLAYALAVITFAFQRKDEVMAKSAVFVLAFAAAKALLYDASSAPTMVRIFCLLITGVALYGAGFLLRKISSWQQS